MTRLTGVIALFCLLIGNAVSAQDNPVVVELYTSQGCSSCPPADALLAKIAKRDDVIALALHVDYWDYIGWKDEFADPANTARQRGYARAAGKRSIYTPQMIIGGKDHVLGHRPMELAKLIKAHSAQPALVDLDITRKGDRVQIQAKAKSKALPRALVVQILSYTPASKVSIRRGENAGRTFEYHNIVNTLSIVGNWDGRGEYKTTARAVGTGPVVVIIQERNFGPVVGAIQLR